MRRPTLSVSGWFAAVCLLGSAVWACSSDDTDLFDEPSRGGTGGASGTDATGGSSGSSTGGSTGGSPAGGSSGSSSGGDATGGTPTGGTTGEGGAAAESGTDSGGTTTGGSGGAGNGGAGSGGTSAGGAGMGGALGGGSGTGGGTVGGAGMGGAGSGGSGPGGAGTGGTGKGGCREDGDCKSTQYCKKATCDAPSGECTQRGPECRGMNAEFEPVCGCDGITYWNSCVIEHDGFNVALHGECTGNNRPTCTRDAGGDSCPERSNAHCYRPMDACGDTSPTMGVCWVLPAECPDDEAQTQRYCGGTAGGARCIGLCEVIEAENTFQRDADRCAN